MIRLTAQQVYDILVHDEDITSATGQIKFFLSDVDIIVKQKDVVGNILQEWLEGWLRKRGIEFDPNPNSQMPPDFFLTKNNHKVNLLEVKAFNYDASPGFDIADFRMYEEEIIDKPYMLDVDYLIFGYRMTNDGEVTVKRVWLKKVWEITRPMKNWPINLQVKANVVHKIRPGKWYANSQIPMFKSLEHFLSAIEQTVWQNPKTREASATWKTKFQNSYKHYYGVKLEFPRWQDIANEYEE